MLIMNVIPNVAVNTLVLASMYILASLGFAFIFNMLGSVNLAHGAFYMTAAYITYYLCSRLGMNNWLAMLLSTVVLALVGIAMERFCFRPFQKEFDSNWPYRSPALRPSPSPPMHPALWIWALWW